MSAPYSGRVIDYLGSGLLAARPAAPNLFPDTVGLYYCTDVGSEKLTAWDGLAWADIAGGGGSGTVTSVGLTAPDIFTVSGSPVTTSGTLDFTPVDPGADRIVFWDDSASKWQYLTLGTNLSITGTTLDAAGGGGSAAWGAITGTLSDQTDLQAALDKVKIQSIQIACSDETTALTTGTAKVTFRMPYAFTLTAVRASLTTAQTSGSILTVDINEGGSTILSTKLTIDNTEKTSTTAATAPVISDANLADDAEITIDIDQIGDGTAKGLKVALIGHAA